MGALIEKWFPTCSGLIFSILYLCLFRHTTFSIPMHDILPNVINISAIAVGFLATASSILITMPNRRIIQKMKTANLYQLIIDYLISATRLCFFLAIISALFLYFDWKTPLFWHHWLFSFWLFFAIISFLSCYRVLPIFFKILKLEL